MSRNVHWEEVYPGIQWRNIERDVPPESAADARDAGVGAIVQFAQSTLDTHSMNWRVQRELQNLSSAVYQLLKDDALRTRRNNKGCLAVVVYSVTEMWFTGQRGTRFLLCSLWGGVWDDPRTAMRNHDQSPRIEPRFGGNNNDHRYFWATIGRR